MVWQGHLKAEHVHLLQVNEIDQADIPGELRILACQSVFSGTLSVFLNEYANLLPLEVYTLL